MVLNRPRGFIYYVKIFGPSHVHYGCFMEKLISEHVGIRELFLCDFRDGISVLIFFQEKLDTFSFIFCAHFYSRGILAHKISYNLLLLVSFSQPWYNAIDIL